MSSPTDTQGTCPAVGVARRARGSVAPGMWQTTSTYEIAMSALAVTAIPTNVSVKRHANFTDRPSEAPT